MLRHVQPRASNYKPKTHSGGRSCTELTGDQSPRNPNNDHRHSKKDSPSLNPKGQGGGQGEVRPPRATNQISNQRRAKRLPSHAHHKPPVGSGSVPTRQPHPPNIRPPKKAPRGKKSPEAPNQTGRPTSRPSPAYPNCPDSNRPTNARRNTPSASPGSTPASARNHAADPA